MKLPQVVIYETDGFLAGQVRRLAGEHSWLVRESRDPDACVKLLIESRPSVLLLKLEREMLDGLTLLGRVVEQAPDCPVIVVSDVKLEGAEHRAQLSALAFDLGARYVLFPPLQQPVIEDLVSGLLSATIRRTVGSISANADDDT
jgi:chemotaxis response regulator CheB